MSNNIKFYFLGNCGSTPTKNRNLSSLAINYDGKNYLLDCPENVQQQLMKKKISITKIKGIFITHFHGDHFFGLFGLLSTMKMNQKEDELHIFIAKNYAKKLREILKLTIYDLPFKLSIIEVDSNLSFCFADLEVSAIKLNHSIDAYGFVFKIKDKIGRFDKKKALSLGVPEGPLFSRLQENKNVFVDNKKIKPEQVIDKRYKKKGFKFAYVLDTAPLKKIPKKLEDLDVLVCESTFLEKHKENAKKFMHLTTKQATELAKQIRPKTFFITHISSRYKEIKDVEKEAKKYFKKTQIPKEEVYCFECFI